MKFENIKLSKCIDATDCYAAIDSIERDNANYTCSAGQWLSGAVNVNEYIKVAAKAKIKALDARADSLGEW